VTVLYKPIITTTAIALKTCKFQDFQETDKMKQLNKTRSSLHSNKSSSRSTTPVPTTSSFFQPNPFRSYRLVRMPAITYPCKVEGWIYVHGTCFSLSLHIACDTISIEYTSSLRNIHTGNSVNGECVGCAGSNHRIITILSFSCSTFLLS